LYKTFSNIAKNFKEGEDYEVDLKHRSVDVLNTGIEKAEKILGWKAKTNWKKLSELMVDADIQLLDDKLSGRKIDD
jgi:GDPmannose 4,6-dehydratase